MLSVTAIDTKLQPVGMLSFGAFHPVVADGVPSNSDGGAGTVVLVGNAGPSMWAAFQYARSAAQRPHPLNGWTREVLSAIASELNAEVVFPFGGPPHYPFQRWALKARAATTSPIGLLIHDEYGLWHAYRGAFVFGARMILPPVPPGPGPCATCEDKPCLSSCPVHALDPGKLDLAVCLGHLRHQRGADCLQLGCYARRACPVGRLYQYDEEQAHFHMEAFVCSAGAVDAADHEKSEPDSNCHRQTW